jgi:short subunit dehydrogenase-like uncharacterized protein
MAAERCASVDIVIFGATGFTGKLVVQYFLRHNETRIGCDSAQTWAIAARDAEKVNVLKRQLKQELEDEGAEGSVVDGIPVIVADGTDRDAMLQLVRSSRVVLSIAGPYAVYSALLVELCAENGVHYCDLAAEMPWVVSNASRLDAVAVASGARLVHCCGFEAVPSDLLTFLLADVVNKPLSRVNFFWKKSFGGASGGTIISLLTMLDGLTPDQKTAMQAPYYYTPSDYALAKHYLVDANTSTKKLPFDSQLGSRSAFFFTGTIDQQVVLRSNCLLQDRYGAHFVYIERMSLASVLNWCITGVMAAFAGLASWKWSRKLLWKIAPRSGRGPSSDMLQRGYFAAEAHAYDERGALVATGEVSGVGDPGYLITSKLVSEVALCLAKGEHDGALSRGGFLTPATACGHSLVKRLIDRHIIDLRARRS